MIIKVCGLTQIDNINAVLQSNIDMVGLNFYPNSKRFISQPLSNINSKVVGVFVNESMETILTKANEFNLDYVQLHGTETPEFVRIVAQHYPIIKAIGILEEKDIKVVSLYTDATYILLDKKSPMHGGTGQKFDWDLLQAYNTDIPFILAGGIGPSDYEALIKINHPQFAGLDLNSQFEIAPGLKDPDLIREFTNIIYNTNNH